MGELLLEVGVEEIPAVLVRETVDQLRDRAIEAFRQARVEAGEIRGYGTPRRLVLSARLSARQQEVVSEVTGPPVSVAYDAAGQPTPAAVGFAKAQGVSLETLKVIHTNRGDYLSVRKEQPSLPTATVLRQLLPTLLAQLQFPKAMRWNESGGRFIRPVRWIAALLDRRVIAFTFAGIASGGRSVGHRWLAPRAVTIRGAADYRTALRRVHVMVDDTERADQIATAIRARAQALGGVLIEEEALMTQAVYTCEWPVVAAGAFDPAYVALPRSVLLAVLQHQQGYFALQQPRGGLMPRFLCVVDGGGRTAARLTGMVGGHERVLRARLEDARFYIKQDLGTKLADRVGALKGMMFHERLGSIDEKVWRLGGLADRMAEWCGVDRELAKRAALLCKADLVTGMVREFPELQGAIGAYYAEQQGESKTVAAAIGEHYQPRSTGDVLPATPIGQLLSLADKVDTVVGYFGIGLAPTGSEDPYALRRQGAGIIQVLGLHPRLSVQEVVQAAHELFVKSTGAAKRNWKGTVPPVIEFLTQRLEWQLQTDGHRADLVAAVVAANWKNPVEVRRRLLALECIIAGPTGDDLMTVFRRVGRIVPKDFAQPVHHEQFTGPEERQLYTACEEARGQVTKALDSGNEGDALQALARLRPAVDVFFSKVMVMAEETAVRDNRLALVNAVKSLFERIADFSKIVNAPAPVSDAAR